MRGTIYQLGLSGIDEPIPLMCFFKQSKQEVKKLLLDLQMGYWQKGDNKPKIREIPLDDDSMMIVAEIYNIDWYYGFRIKKSVWNAKD